MQLKVVYIKNMMNISYKIYSKEMMDPTKKFN